MIRIRDITLPPGHTTQQLMAAAAKLLRVTPQAFTSFRVARKSLDARKKEHIVYVYTVDVELPSGEDRALRRGGAKVSEAPNTHYVIPSPTAVPSNRPVVVGFGPAGMFAALVLAKAGLRPLVIERGCDAQTRHRMVENFWSSGILSPDSNVQFGEGGAGAFSDGKLNTGTHDPRNYWILEQLVAFGAQNNILYDAKPHIGTDVLLKVIQRLRQEVTALGGEVLFCTKLTGLSQRNGRLAAITAQTSEGLRQFPCDRLILAIGHSARDTYRMLEHSGIALEPKPFAMGARIEHLQSHLNRAQYGGQTGLPPADYKLFHHMGERTAYTFCMCPGGHVVAAASEPESIVTNGMSYSARDGINANSALLISLQPQDFPYPGALGGMLWQQELERRAYAMTGSYRAPAQRVEDFLQHRVTTRWGEVQPTYRPGVSLCDLHDLLPPVITTHMEQGLAVFARKLSVFAHPDAVLTGPETRSSSPVRICRNEYRQSVSLAGLYPCGEGAGYAGGILSAAADGIRCAEALILSLCP